MKLTWEDFFKYTSILRNLYESIFYFTVQTIEIKEKNRKVAVAANEYRNLFKDFKFVEFSKLVRIS